MALAGLFKKKIIAVDNSTNSTAFSIWAGGELLDYGEIYFSGKDTYERIVAVREALAPLREKCADVQELYIEAATFVNSTKTVILLSLAEGAVISSIAHPTMKVQRVSPLVWQKHIGNPPWTRKERADFKKNSPGKTAGWYKTEERRLRKQKTLDIVNSRYGLDVVSDNVGDSLGLGTWVINK